MLIVGLDGATFTVLSPLLEQGKLPNLENLVKEGASSILKFAMPPVSGPAWHAFRIGKNPGRTGVYDFLRHNPQSYRSELIQLGQLPDSTLWEIVEENSDYRIGIDNLPGSYLPNKVRGFLVVGFPLPDNAKTMSIHLSWGRNGTN